jgi:hypothetical protein
MKKIFVNVCSYRDRLLEPTLRSLMENESGRNAITYGVFEQTKLEDSLVKKAPDLVNHPQVKYKRIEPEFSDGVMWARGINAMQVTDEEFQYQIDSHMLFDKGWDHYLILDYYHVCDIEKIDKILLTCGTKNYDLEGDKITKHTLSEDISVNLGYFQFDKNLRLHAHGAWVESPKIAKPAIHICAGNFFAPTKWIREVGYNTRVFFEGEEQILVISSILADYKIYHQRKIKVYHYLRSATHESKQTNSPIISESRIKIRQDISVKEISDYIYSLTEEQLEKYRRVTGVDYINRKLEHRAISRSLQPYPGVTNDWEIPDRGD